jgi:transcriptional regulator with XRE-family HTH domain
MKQQRVNESTERRDYMRINPEKLALAMAKSCLTTRDLQVKGQLSNATITKAKNDPDYKPTLKTIGKIANALNVSVEYLTEKGGK